MSADLPRFTDDPELSVLDRPYTWELVGIFWHKGNIPEDEPFIDLSFRRDGESKRLRFYRPEQLSIDPDMNPNCLGMCILDVSGRDLDGINVRVANFEQGSGAPRFWANRVVDMGQFPEGTIS